MYQVLLNLIIVSIEEMEEQGEEEDIITEEVKCQYQKEFFN